MNYHFQMPGEEVQQVEVWFTDCDSDREQSSTINATSPELNQEM